MYAGIDYGMGQANIDPHTGIRYGIIPANDLHEWFWEEVESIYLPRCPHCGNDLKTGKEYKRCPHCRKVIQMEDCYFDEPDSNELRIDGYEGFVDSGNDVWVTKSPYYTRAQFCSPCAPGAGYLRNECEDGPKTYCFGHDMFDGGKVPYRVFKVADDTEVLP